MKLYKRLIVLLTSGIMGIGLITLNIQPATPVGAVVDESKDNNSKTDINASVTPDKSAEVVTPTATPEPTPTPEPNFLERDAYPAVNKLVSDYLNAQLECDPEVFKTLVTDMSYVDLDKMLKKTEYITGFSDITCYTKKGTGPIKYVVYYTYNMTLATIDTPAFCINQVNISLVDGIPKIFFGEISDEDYNYIISLQNDDDVQELITSAYETMSQAAAADENLAAFWHKINTIDTETAEPETASGSAATVNE